MTRHVELFAPPRTFYRTEPSSQNRSHRGEEPAVFTKGFAGESAQAIENAFSCHSKTAAPLKFWVIVA